MEKFLNHLIHFKSFVEIIPSLPTDKKIFMNDNE